MKKLSKILVLVLTLSLLLGMFAVFSSAATSVAKIGDTEYATLADAVSAAAQGDTITLISDVTVSATITVGKDVTIDLNDYTITSSEPLFFVAGAGAKLAVKNGTVNATKDVVMTSGASEVDVTLKNLDVALATNAWLVQVKAASKCLVEDCNVFGATAGGGIYIEKKVDLDIKDSVIGVRQQALCWVAGSVVIGATYDFYNTVFMGYGYGQTHGAIQNGGAYGRLIRNNDSNAIVGLEYTYADGGSDTSKVVIGNNAPSVNFYGCEIYSYGDRVFQLGNLNWNLYGGYVFSGETNLSRAFSGTQTYQTFELHSYTDPETGVTTYPTFNYSLEKYSGSNIIKGFHDVTVTATGTTTDGVFTPTSIAQTKSVGTAGAFYATEKGFAWVPNSDESEYAAAIRNSDAYVAHYYGGFMRETSTLSIGNPNTVSNIAFSFGSHSWQTKTNLDLQNFKLVSPKTYDNDPYLQLRWSAATASVPQSWFIFGGASEATGHAAANNNGYLMKNVDYFTYDLDIKAPDNGTILGRSTNFVLAGNGNADSNKLYIKLNGSKMAIFDGGACISGNVDLNDGNWHHLTFIIEVNHADYTDCTYNLFLDGVKIYSKAIAGTYPNAEQRVAGIRINMAGGTAAEGEGYCFDNFRCALYGFSTSGATGYDGFTNLDTVTNLSELDEYKNYSFRTSYAASIGDTYYDTYAAAYAAAKPGDRIELYADVEGEQSPEKALVIDTNGYKFNYDLFCGYRISKHGTGNSVITFAEVDESEKLTIVYKDAEGEELITINTVRGNVPNDDYSAYVPALSGEYDYDEALDKVVCSQMWVLQDSSTENNLVYAPGRGAIEALFVILNTETGAYISHGTTFDEFYTAVNRPSTEFATTLKLLDDLDFTRNEYIGIQGAHKPFTLDLNGHTFDDQNATRYAATNNRGVFRPVGTGGAVFNITSSKEGAKIIHTAPKNAARGDQFIWVTGADVTVNIDGGITFFGARFVSVGAANVKVNVDELTMIQTGGDGQAFFQLYGDNAALDVSDSKMYSVSGWMLSGSYATANALFDNCEILAKTNAQKFLYQDAASCIIGTVTFNDCAVYADVAPFEGTVTKVKLAGDTILNSASLEGVTVESGRTLTAVDAVGHKTDSRYTDFTLDTSDTINYTFKYVKTDNVNYTFTHTTMKDADLAKIEWTLGGVVKATTKYIPDLDEQKYRYTERFTEGYIINTYVGNKTAALTAGVTPVELSHIRETYISGLKYSLSLDSSIGINLIIPKAAYESEGFKLTDENGNAIAATLVTVEGKEYYLAAVGGITAVSATDEETFLLALGDSLAQTVKLSVAGYAAQLLENGANDVERELARAILQYALDAEKALDSSDAISISTLEMLLGEQVNKGAANNGFGSVRDMAELYANTAIGSISLKLDSTLGFVFKADEGATVEKFTVTCGSIRKALSITEAGGEAVLSLKACNFDTELTVTVDGVDYRYNLATCLDDLCNLAEAGTAADALNSALANSLYNYVKAAKAFFYDDVSYDSAEFNVFEDTTSFINSSTAVNKFAVKYVDVSSGYVALMCHYKEQAGKVFYSGLEIHEITVYAKEAGNLYIGTAKLSDVLDSKQNGVELTASTEAYAVVEGFNKICFTEPISVGADETIVIGGNGSVSIAYAENVPLYDEVGNFTYVDGEANASLISADIYERTLIVRIKCAAKQQ